MAFFVVLRCVQVLFGVFIDRLHGQPRLRRVLLPISSAVGLFAILQIYMQYTGSSAPNEAEKTWICCLIGLQGFFVLGAYSTLAGVFALEIGGKECCAVHYYILTTKKKKLKSHTYFQF